MTSSETNIAQAEAGKAALLIIYHSQSGKTESLARAIHEGASRISAFAAGLTRAGDTTATDIDNCRALVICSPEYFGYMAGAIKDLFDRTYEALQGRVSGKPYVVVICAGNDGSGALAGIERIIKGYGLRRVQAPIVSRGEVSEDTLNKCRELGETLAAGIDLGIY